MGLLEGGCEGLGIGREPSRNVSLERVLGVERAAERVFGSLASVWQCAICVHGKGIDAKTEKQRD